MPDLERAMDDLKIKIAKDKGHCKGRSADYWDGYRSGKSCARWEVAIAFAIVYFSIAAIGYFFS